ncbi:ankyrin repeat-containing protein [Elysia marginata]|uniref:Ankyrin repeat-containing protein n=1 Tax=Elysia marginata TaxID=1093978 RepID=A0AAV4GWH3_9GAST|nr:ankyrin repeat-containing protein [Elysia marginata]
MTKSQLSNAICCRDIDGVKRILESVECSLNEDPPIIKCMRLSRKGEMDDDDFKRCEILKLLVHDGADVNVLSSPQPNCNGNRETAVVIAAKGGYFKCLQFLVDSGADLRIASSYSEETALMVAAREGEFDCVKFLTQRMPASMLNHKNKSGKTALMLSAMCTRRGGLPCLRELIESSADLEIKDENGETALMLALQAHSHSDESLIFLLEKGAFVNATRPDEETPLMMACRNISSEVVELMLKKGAHVNAVSQLGDSLPCVSRFKHIPTLLRYGLDLTVSRRNQRSLHVGIKDGLVAELRTYVMNGFPPINIQLNNLPAQLKLHHFETPMSPLAYAVCYRRPGIAKYLITNRFLTRFDIVQLSWDKPIRQYLQDIVSNDGNSNKCRQAKQCLWILDFLSTKPQPLRDLCLITVSRALSQDYALGFQRRTEFKIGWVCTPTFRERVNQLNMPSVFKRELLHQTSSAAICCRSWDDIILGEENDLPKRHCGDYEAD